MDARVGVQVRVLVRVGEEKGEKGRVDREWWKGEEEERCRMEDEWMNGGDGWNGWVEWVDEGYDVV